MRPKTAPFFLCRFRGRPDATRRKLRRCRVCGRVLRFVFADELCANCTATAVTVKGGRSCK